MTLKDLMASDMTDVILNDDEHAISVTQWPQGVEGSAVSPITAVFNAIETRRELTRGVEYVFRATLTLLASVTVNPQDVWVIDEVTYQTLKIGDAEEGGRIIEIQRNDKDHTSGSGTLL